MRPKSSCSLSKNDTKNYLFSETVFFSKTIFLKTKNAVLTGRPNVCCSNTRNDPKKVNKRFKFFRKKFSSKCSHGEVESNLKAPLTFFRQPAEFFPLDIQKKTNSNFSKRFSPEIFLWNWESSFDEDAEISPTKPGDFRSMSKEDWKKNLIKSFKKNVPKIFPWTFKFRCWQPRRKFSDKVPNKIRLLSKNNGKVYALKNSFCSKVLLCTRRMQF